MDIHPALKVALAQLPGANLADTCRAAMEAHLGMGHPHDDTPYTIAQQDAIHKQLWPQLWQDMCSVVEQVGIQSAAYDSATCDRPWNYRTPSPVLILPDSGVADDK